MRRAPGSLPHENAAQQMRVATHLRAVCSQVLQEERRRWMNLRAVCSPVLQEECRRWINLTAAGTNRAAAASVFRRGLGMRLAARARGDALAVGGGAGRGLPGHVGAIPGISPDLWMSLGTPGSPTTCLSATAGFLTVAASRLRRGVGVPARPATHGCSTTPSAAAADAVSLSCLAGQRGAQVP